MKKLLFTVLALFSIFITTATAQNVPNGSFENWNLNFYFSDPDNFWTTNFQAYFSGANANVTKTTDVHSGNFALKLEGVEVDTNVIPGAVAIGTPGPDGFAGGYPYNELPDTLSFFAKYDIAPGDTGFIFIIFKTSGAPISANAYQFAGTQPDYQQFKLPVSSMLPVQPDSFLFFLATSANFDNATAGNLIYIDDIEFIGSTAPFPNGGFEEWTDITDEVPGDGWVVSNFFNLPSDPSVTKTTNAYSGNFAIRLENKISFYGEPFGSFAIIGTLGENGPEGGFPLSDTPKKISGFYQYAPVGVDSSIFLAKFSKWNSATHQTDSIAETKVSLPPANSYTAFEIPFDFNWSAQPDSMTFGFSPSYLDEDSALVVLGSVLYVDALALEFVSGIRIQLGDYLSFVNAFPNPADNVLHLDFELAFQTPLNILVYDSQGKKIKAFDKGMCNNQVKLELPVGDLSSGSYYYSILTNKGVYNGKFVVK